MSETSELIGRVFDNRYQITELIGRGGMGSVYKAIHIAMNQVVALKVMARSLTTDEKQVQRFYQEAKASSRLKHPNTIKVFDFGKSEDGNLYLAMEYLEGISLGTLLRQEKVLPVRRAIHIAKQVCKSLGEAHMNGLVHRDLKPDNVFICKVYGEEDFVKVLDFGISKFLEGDPDHENLTQSGLVCGTPLYISPEQALGRSLDGRADLYALGVILYEMVSGRPPFRGDTPIALVMKHIHDKPPPMKEHNPKLVVPDSLNNLIMRLLEKDRTKRPATAEEVIKALEAIEAAGGFPEVPSKEVIYTDVIGKPGGKTRVETPVGDVVDHEQATQFLPEGEEAKKAVDSEAPTTFMSRDESIEKPIRRATAEQPAKVMGKVVRIGGTDEVEGDEDDDPTEVINRTPGFISQLQEPQTKEEETGEKTSVMPQVEEEPVKRISQSVRVVRRTTGDYGHIEDRVIRKGKNLTWLWVAAGFLGVGIVVGLFGYIQGWYEGGEARGLDNNSLVMERNLTPEAPRVVINQPEVFEEISENEVVQVNVAKIETPKVEEPKVVEPEQKELTIRLEVNPPDTTIFLGGKLVGKSPYSFMVKNGDPPIQFAFKAKGYKDRALLVQPSTLIAENKTMLKIDMEKVEEPKPKEQVPTPSTSTGGGKPPPNKIKKPKPTLKWD